VEYGNIVREIPAKYLLNQAAIDSASGSAGVYPTFPPVQNFRCDFAVSL